MREAFDKWYEEEHLPDALKAFGALRAWRGWSEVDPSVHYAWIRVRRHRQGARAPGVGGAEGLVAEFDRAWGDKVVRSRDIVQVAQRI